jgi:uncharacterized protein (TIGR00106 family)
MKVIMDLCLVPIGVGTSLSRYIAACEAVLSQFNIKRQLHAYGTNLEGEWDEVMAAVKACHDALHDMGVPRVSTTVKLGTRNDREQTMEDKVASVNALRGCPIQGLELAQKTEPPIHS